MNAQEYSNEIKCIRVGKSLPDAIYIHRTALEHESFRLYELSMAVARALKLGNDWDLVKLFKKEHKISLLSYPTFYEESYPALRMSSLVDLTKLSLKQTNYSESENPPILHRKELMVLPNDPYYDHFCELTLEGEVAGLYENAFKIGFRQSWLRTIEEAGYQLEDGRLEKRPDTGSVNPVEKQVDRHLTAIVRHDFSTPFKILLKHDLLQPTLTVFDYGCGRGDDLRELEAHGMQAAGWDPNFLPDADLIESDIVNLGFVINVIEDRDERIEALSKAHQLSRRLTIISAMIAGESVTGRFEPYKDGVLTSRNTFQKYYSQSELQRFIEDTLDTEAVAAAPGVFIVFKNKNDEQQFYLNRNKSRRTWTRLSERPEVKGTHELAYVGNRELLDEFWNKCLDLGRLPLHAEFDRSDALIKAMGSIIRAYRIVTSVLKSDDLKQAANSRIDDLTVYFALALFGRRPHYKTMPLGLQQDIKTFFGNYTKASEVGKEALFKIAEPTQISAACDEAVSKLPACRLVQSDHMLIHTQFLNALPQLLRIYVGAAEQLLGSADDFNLIKIHIRSGKVTFLRYEDFNSSPLPLLIERVKVNLRDQEIDFFDYVEPYTPSPLYWKGEVIDESFPDFKKQLGFDRRLRSFGLLDESSEHGVDRGELDFMLLERGFKIQGYRFFAK